MRKIKSDVVIKKGPHGWEAWQTNKLLAKVPGFGEDSKEEVMKHIPGYENVIESSSVVKSSRSQANLEGYNCGHKGDGDLTDNPYNSNTENEDWNDWRAGFSEGEHDRIHNSTQIQSAAYSVHYNKTNEMHDSLENFAKTHDVDNWSSVGPAWTSFDWNGHHFYIEIHYEQDREGERGAAAEISVDKGPKSYSWDVVDYLEENYSKKEPKVEEEPRTSEPLFYVKNSKQIKSSPNFKDFTADDIFDSFQVEELTSTVFMDREQCKNNKCGMEEFSDLMYDVLPTYLGVSTADDVRKVCNRAKNPKAKAFLEAFETAMENAKFTDKFYNSVVVHKKNEPSKSLTSRFYQNGGDQLYTLSEAAQYLSALFFDLRTIHFLTTGSEFYTYHELAQELYEQTEDYYDDLVETAIGYDSDVQPMYVLPGDWNFVDEHGALDTEGKVPQTLILDRLEMVYDILENVQQYDSMVSSKLDAMKEYYDKEIYKLKQALK